jgi:hypothetical protein
VNVPFLEFYLNNAICNKSFRVSRSRQTLYRDVNRHNIVTPALPCISKVLQVDK